MPDPCDSWTTLITIQLPHHFQLTWVFNFLCASIYLHFTLHWVTMDMANNGDVAKTTYDTTQHDTIDYGVHVKLLRCWVMDAVFACSIFSSTWNSVIGSLMVLVFHMVQCICSIHLFLYVIGTFFEVQESLLACALLLHPIHHLPTIY